METNGKASKKEPDASEVVLVISSKEGEEEEGKTHKPAEVTAALSTESTNKLTSPSSQMSCPSPEIARFSRSPSKPPKSPAAAVATLTNRRSLARSVYSKPKSRFGEQPCVAADVNLIEERMAANKVSSHDNKVSPSSTPKETKGTVPITPKTPLMASPGPGGGAHDEDEEIYKRVSLKKNEQKHKRVKTKVLIESICFLCIIGCLIASLTIGKLEELMIWGLELWKWTVLLLVIFCGMFVTNWIMHFLVLLIESNFLLRKKVLYFVHGLKKSVQVFIWLSLVLLTWCLLFNGGIHQESSRSTLAYKILYYITWTIVSVLVGSFLWLIKTLLLKVLAASFNVNTFFDRIQESVFHQYVLQTLSGSPLMEMAEKVGKTGGVGQVSFNRIKKKGKEKKGKEVIDVAKLQRMKQEKVSAWTMKVLVDVISKSGLSTISNTIDESVDGGENEQSEITNEMEAIAAAYHIFRNVAQPGLTYIDEEDLLRFMIREEVDIVFPLFEGAESGRIERKALTDWVVKVYEDRKALACALSDTKTAVKQLNKLVSAVLIVVVIIIWLLLIEIATTKVLLFLSSQLVLAAFMFGNTCKTIFEAIIFVFVMHPFDVGDRCVIDGVQMVVEEMNILTTVFLRYDKEKIFYPNSVLATKPISNYYRSPDMGDSLEFSIDVMTPVDSIGCFKEEIKKYLETNCQHWHPNHSVVVKEIENVNKLKMALFVNHTMNYQNFIERNKRRSELVMELKRIFEELHIKYNLLPQEVLLKQVNP